MSTHTRLPFLTVPLCIIISVMVWSLLANFSSFSLPELLFSSLYAVRFLLCALLYVGIVRFHISARTLFRFLYVTGIFVGLLGFVQLLLYPDLRNLYYLGFDPHSGRLTSLFLDPNFAGIFFVLSFCLGIFLWEMKNKNALLILVGQCILLASLFFTFSRSSYLAFFSALLVYISVKKSWKIAVTGLIMCLALLMIPKPNTEGGNIWRVTSSLARVVNYQEGIALFVQKPLFGHGFNTLGFIRKTAPVVSATGVVIPSKAKAGLDSSILFIVATTGLTGLFAFVFLFWKIYTYARELLQKKQKYMYGLLVSMAGVSILIHSLFVNSMFYVWVMLWFFVLIGAVEEEAGNNLTVGR